MTPDDLVLTPQGVRYRGRVFPCSIGKRGVTRDKREGDKATPAGVMRITGLWYRPDRLARPAPWAQPIGPGDLWCDAPDHPAYNHHARAPLPASHERLRRADPLYDLVDGAAELTAHPTIDEPTFGKWGPQLRASLGEAATAAPLLIAGVSTDCCVIATVLAAADAGAHLTVVTGACAASDEAKKSAGNPGASCTPCCSDQPSRCATPLRSSSSSARVLSMAFWLKSSTSMSLTRVYSPFCVVTGKPKITPSGMP